MGDFGASCELTEINRRLLKDDSMGSAIDCAKNFVSNNSTLIIGVSILVLGLWAMSEDKKAKR
jgi:hypothetical protein